ncbi:hypothetical protein, partial [Pseudomonas izuensis]|uniref:hypothetical protein n=1 Tax=Pseudomonas izuensis TaxID=2684212 RepID=UPI001C49B19B
TTCKATVSLPMVPTTCKATASLDRIATSQDTKKPGLISRAFSCLYGKTGCNTVGSQRHPGNSA